MYMYITVYTSVHILYNSEHSTELCPFFSVNNVTLRNMINSTLSLLGYFFCEGSFPKDIKPDWQTSGIELSPSSYMHDT